MEKTKAITEKLESLKVAKSEAEATLRQIMVDVESKKVELGDKMVAGKSVQMTDLDALNENKTRQELVLSAIGVQIEKAERELVKAKEAEYKAERDALRDEGKKQLVEIVKTIETLYKLSAKFRAFTRKANAKLQNEFGRGGLTPMGIPVDDIYIKTDVWLGRASIGNRTMQELLTDAGIMSHVERKKFADQEFYKNAKM